MKSKFSFLVLLLALATGGQRSTAQVTNLGMGPAGSQHLIYWPLSTTNYVLQSSSNLAAGSWTTVTNATTISAVTVPNTAAMATYRLLPTNSPTAGMALIPGGAFTLGNYLFYATGTNDPDYLDASPTNVTVSPFYIDTNLVSLTQWTAVYAYATAQGYTFTHPGTSRAGNNPVQTVSWFDATAWCNARSAQAGLPPCYFTEAALTHPYTNASGTNVYLKIANNGYRLPTEAEWEKAARGGLIGLRFPWGNLITENLACYYAAPGALSYDVNPYAGFNTNYIIGYTAYTSPVGSFAPNGYGLYDMAGNVLQWCGDWYAGPPFPAGSPYLGGTNATGAATGKMRVMRGGYWGAQASYSRTAARNSYAPVNANYLVGFRCVKGL